MNIQLEMEQESIGRFIWRLNILCNITCGFYDRILHFKSLSNYSGESYINENKLNLYYCINEVDYQYYKVVMNGSGIIKVEGDCANLVLKIFDLYNNINDSIVEKYQPIVKLMYVIKCDEENKWASKLKEIDMEKIKTLNVLHSKLLLNCTIDEIINNLLLLYDSWEINNFEINNSLTAYTRVKGYFTNYEIPNIEIKSNNKTIIFPDDSRGSLCSNFIVVSNFEDIDFEEGKIILLKNHNKKGRVNKYKILEKNYNDFIAVENLETKDIEFLTNWDDVYNAYDALFECNKKIYNGWLNKKYDYII